ncbi:hypothetical protein CXB51_035099 [Gossypium anomalum]|uniref:GRF-type domain-containing protein n=1 Tax=Gossypium anomalum TaxID=47600 RepID=A0A8J5YEC6_9ROSI|nr:hypothetical protein CXB51_035099 [Gossypium anomalum]
MSSSINRKFKIRSVLYCHCELRVLVCNANTPRNKGRKFFKCANFKEIGDCDFFRWVEGNSDNTNSTREEQ